MTTECRKKCPLCGSNKLGIQSGHKNYTTCVGDKAIEFPALDLAWEKCGECGEEFFDALTLKRIQIAQMGALELLTPAELKSFRTRHKMTQVQMADLLQIGAKTYLRWERGQSIQTKALDNYIRRVMSDMEGAPTSASEKRAIIAEATEEREEAPNTTRFRYVDESASQMWVRSLGSTPSDQFPFEMLPNHGHS